MELTQKNLKGQKIAVLMADGFEMAEYTVPINALRMAGAKITVISLRRGRIRGVNLHEPAHRIHADLTIDKASVEDFDALFIPGGFINPDLLRQSQLAREFVREFVRTKKPVATLCHGPWVLGSSGVLKGKVLTSWAGIRDDVVNAGGTWLDQPVVRDGTLLTSRGPQDFAEFVPALLEFFADPASESASRRSADRPSSSPQRTEPPALVLGTMRWMPRPSFRGFALGVLIGGAAAMLQRNRPRPPQTRLKSSRTQGRREIPVTASM